MSMKKKVISYINKVIYFNFLKCVVVHMKRNLSDMFFFSSSYCMLFVFLIFMKLYKVIHLTSIYSILHLKTHYKINNQYIKKITYQTVHRNTKIGHSVFLDHTHTLQT